MTVLFGLLALLIGTPASAEPPLWVVHGPHATVFILGSVHLLRPGSDWEGPHIHDAVAAADTLWFEMVEPTDPTATQALVVRTGFDLKHKLSDLLSPADRSRLDAAARSSGLPDAAVLDVMRPWMAALVIAVRPMVQAGYDPELGPDHVLQIEAAQAGKPVHGFETMERQMGFLADLPDELSLGFLVSTLDDLDGGIVKLDAIVAKWLAGQPIGADVTDAIQRSSPELYRVLFVERNEAWTPQIKALVEGEGVVLITVGAGHLEGPDSVLADLAREGVTFELVPP